MHYGVEGIGKSTFGSHAPTPIVILTDDELDEIECDRFRLATTLDETIVDQLADTAGSLLKL